MNYLCLSKTTAPIPWLSDSVPLIGCRDGLRWSGTLHHLWSHKRCVHFTDIGKLPVIFSGLPSFAVSTIPGDRGAEQEVTLWRRFIW